MAEPPRDEDEDYEFIDSELADRRHGERRRLVYVQQKNGNGNGASKAFWILIPINIAVLLGVIAWTNDKLWDLQIQVAKLEGSVAAILEAIKPLR